MMRQSIRESPPWSILVGSGTRRSRRSPKLQSLRREYRRELGPLSLGSGHQDRFQRGGVSSWARLLFHVHLESWRPCHFDDPGTAELGGPPAHRNGWHLETQPCSSLLDSQQQGPRSNPCGIKIAAWDLLRRPQRRFGQGSVPDRDQL